jgi:tellurite methyltransferase
MEHKDIKANKKYWNEFYKTNFKHTPSQFCVNVLTEVSDDSVIVELGSGNGRDSLYFASQGHVTFAMDLSSEAIHHCKEEAKKRSVEHVHFIQGDLSKESDVKAVIQEARNNSKGSEMVYYSRFVIHSLDDDQEDKMLSNLSTLADQNEKVYFEFRTKEDEKLDKHFGNHYRRYVDSDRFIQKLTDLGFELEYQMKGQGMAKFLEEDPVVIRIIAKKA